MKIKKGNYSHLIGKKLYYMDNREIQCKELSKIEEEYTERKSRVYFFFDYLNSERYPGIRAEFVFETKEELIESLK